MIKQSLLVALGALGALLVHAAPARADVPPEPGYVESCTIEKHGGPENCIACRDAYHANRDACEQKWGPQGYTRACRTSGASVWTEVWCKPGGGEAVTPPAPATPPTPAATSTPAAPPAPQATKGCATAPGASTSASGLLAAIGALLLLGATRRRARRA